MENTNTPYVKKPFGAGRTTDVATAGGGATGAQGPKKAKGKALYRVKQKNEEGKWITLGTLYENTNSNTGEKFLSFAVEHAIQPGLHTTFTADPPAAYIARTAVNE